MLVAAITNVQTHILDILCPFYNSTISKCRDRLPEGVFIKTI